MIMVSVINLISLLFLCAKLTDATGAAGGSPAFVQETPWIGKKTRSVAMEDTVR